MSEPSKAPAVTPTATAPAASGTDGSGPDIVMTPMPPGAWQLLLGVLLAALAPLGGFLGGSMVGTGSDTARYSPIFMFLFGGIIIGAVGVVVAALGGLRLFRHLRAEQGESGV